ncbi:EAL domain-containing protein [Paracoccus xiamenensis]|uniref:EAL domain-containing protein n=1 Tax=Paracoccus xiamenensis TaxID=2714901 RepID=UPI0014082A00|nr:EAL domain-containing protein [Paracoccus xiamenensis]NHF73804.1 EAL domain-containing protein [Paracoccus xiamenensis]
MRLLQIIRTLLGRLTARDRNPDQSLPGTNMQPAGTTPATPTRPAPGPQYRPQICCHTGQVASVQIFAPDHLAGDADALLRLGLRQLQRWDDAGLRVPCLSIQLPSDMVRSEAMALPLIWEIDRQEIETHRLIFTAPDDRRHGRNLAGLGLLGRHGCGVELCCLDHDGLALLEDQQIRIARLRIPSGALRDCHLDPGRGQVVLSLLALAEHHDLPTIADGVLSRDEHGFLAQLGCSVVQGDAVAPMLDADGASNFLRENARIQSRQLLQPRPAA